MTRTGNPPHASGSTAALLTNRSSPILILANAAAFEHKKQLIKEEKTVDIATEGM
jgi:hypothetical protein